MGTFVGASKLLCQQEGSARAILFAKAGTITMHEFQH